MRIVLAQNEVAAIDQDDAESLACFARVKNGVPTWLDANFTTPVDYDALAEQRIG